MSHMGLLISMSGSKCAEGVEVSSHLNGYFAVAKAKSQVRAGSSVPEEAGHHLLSLLRHRRTHHLGLFSCNACW